MTLERMTNLIRFEAQIEGSDTLTGYIVGLINQLLTEYTGKQFFQELFLIDQPLANPGAGIQNWVLPTDIQHWLPDSVRFSEGGTLEDNRTLYNGQFARDNDGFPYRYIRAGGELRLWPYSDISISSLVWINYYKYPTELLKPTDIFPIPSLESTVMAASVARVSRYSKTDRSREFKAEEQKAFTASNAQENRANLE